MAQFNVSASQLRTAKQNIQNKYARIELLNSNFQVVENLEGNCIGGNINIDAESDMRRSGSVQLVVTDSSFNIQSGGKIFLDKFVRVYIGTYSLVEGEIIYTNCGTFIIDQPTYYYDAENNTLTLSLLDLMANLSGVRNGYLEGIPTRIVAGENIRSVIIDTLALGGFTKYVCEEAPEPGIIPNDLEFSQGSTIFDILSALRDIYPNYEMYFDVDGVFHYNHIPTGENEPVQMDDTLWDDIVISEDIDVNFQNVKNSIEVYGKTHDPQHFSSATTISSGNIKLTISSVSTLEENIIYGFVLPAHGELVQPTLYINNTSTLHNIVDDTGARITLPADSEEKFYCVVYNGTNYWWLGGIQAYAKVEDDNPDSPYYVEAIGRIRLPLYGAGYDNIFSDHLAMERAKYELWSRTQLQNFMVISCVPVEWMDVNALVSYTSRETKETSKWIIRRVDFSLDPNSEMTIQMVKFYPNYFYI